MQWKMRVFNLSNLRWALCEYPHRRMLRESALTRDHLTYAFIFVQSGVRWLLVEFNFGSERVMTIVFPKFSLSIAL